MNERDRGTRTCRSHPHYPLTFLLFFAPLALALALTLALTLLACLAFAHSSARLSSAQLGLAWLVLHLFLILYFERVRYLSVLVSSIPVKETRVRSQTECCLCKPYTSTIIYLIILRCSSCRVLENFLIFTLGCVLALNILSINKIFFFSKILIFKVKFNR